MDKITLRRVTLFEGGLTGLRLLTEKLNKRSERHGMERVDVTVVAEHGFVPLHAGRNKDGKRTYGFGISVPLYDVEIDGCAPRINGWALACRVEFNDIIGQVVRIAPGRPDDGSYVAYRDIGPICEHCNTNRRRGDIFVLEHSDGSRKIVGRNCLADFLRTGDADTFAAYAEWCDRIAQWGDDDFAGECESEGWGYGGRISPTITLDKFLTVVSMLTRRLGWVSRTEARDNPGKSATAGDAGFYLYGRGKAHKEWIEDNELYIEAKDSDIAAKAIAWVQSVEPGTSEYLHTIVKIGKAGLVDRSIDGYAASIIRAWQKDCEFQSERAAKAKGAKTKVFIGSKGERMRDQRVRVVRLHPYTTDFGVKTIVAMEADMPDGSVAPITWFASGEQDFDVDCEYNMTATIKDHKDDDRYGKQTIVQRAKLESREQLVA